MTDTSNTARRPSVWRRFRVSRVGITIAVVAFLVLGGTGAYAYWAVNTQMTNTATSGKLAITGEWTQPITASFTNIMYSQTAQFKVTNTTVATGSKYSATSMPYSIAFSATGGPNALTTNLEVTAWKVSAAACNIASPPTSAGRWGGSPAIPTASGSLAPGATETWCVRTGVAERSQLGSTAGSLSITPSLVATLTLSTTSWTKASVPATGTQTTSYIYTVYNSLGTASKQIVNQNGKCADVKDSKNTVGTTVIQFTCHGKSNQQWKGATAITNYMTFQPQNATSRVLEVTGTDSGTGATIQTPVASPFKKDQQWQLQDQSNGYYQLVNNNSGMCLTAPDNNDNTQLVQLACNGTSSQKFRFPASSVTMTCSSMSGGFLQPRYNKYTFPANTPSSGPLWTITVGTVFSSSIPANSGSFNIENSDIPNNSATYDVRVTDGNGFLVYTSSLRSNSLFGFFPSIDC